MFESKNRVLLITHILTTQGPLLTRAYVDSVRTRTCLRF